MKGTRILVGIMAISLGLGATGSAMAQRGGGGGGHGGSGGTSMMHREAQGSAGAAGTREHQRDMIQERQQLNREEGMQRQSRHEFTQRQGEPRGNNGQQAETREHRQEHSAQMGHPEGETHPGPSDQASTTAHEAVDHHGEGTGTSAAVHAVNSSQNHAEEEKAIKAGQ